MTGKLSDTMIGVDGHCPTGMAGDAEYRMEYAPYHCEIRQLGRKWLIGPKQVEFMCETEIPVKGEVDEDGVEDVYDITYGQDRIFGRNLLTEFSFQVNQKEAEKLSVLNNIVCENLQKILGKSNH